MATMHESAKTGLKPFVPPITPTNSLVATPKRSACSTSGNPVATSKIKRKQWTSFVRPSAKAGRWVQDTVSIYYI